MEQLYSLERLKKVYDSGSNIMNFLREYSKNDMNDESAILLSYELQAGTYIESFYKNQESNIEYARELANYIKRIDLHYNNATMLEVGIGEATTFANVLKYLELNAENCYGLDISWSRLSCAQYFLKDYLSCSTNLMTGTLFQMPFKDNAIDIVYTSHSMEPNGGREVEAIKELYRITKRYLFLFEPAYELADEKQRARMREHGYIQNLYSHAKTLGYHVIEHALLKHSKNSLNPTAVLIIEKNETVQNDKSDAILCCPITHTPLKKYNNVMYTSESFLMYTIIKDIFCLLPENAIPGIKFL